MKKKKQKMFRPFVLLVLSFALSLTKANVIRHQRSAQSYSKRDGVHLEGRHKSHGLRSEVCPTGLPYCECKVRGSGLDITCARINSYKFRIVCQMLNNNKSLVRYFKVRHSEISHLENEIFLGMKIQHLYIHNSNLETLGEHSLETQKNTLNHLVLSNNKLKHVPSAAIRELSNVEHLNLNENNIKKLKNGDFDGLSKVTMLTIYNNEINSIDKDAFSGLKRFVLPHEGSERDLIRLNLGKNFLSRIPTEALLPLKYLQNLDLSENKISRIDPGDFEGLSSLDHLTLNNNQLNHLGQGYFRGLRNLTTLYIDHNQIKTIHFQAFEGLEANLKSLSLSKNQIEIFPSMALRRIHMLETLHLDNNDIERLDEDAFQGFGEHIKFLWLQKNMIRDIPAPAFQDLHSLEWIKLYSNDLKTLHYELMEPILNSLMHIDIHSNPLICDCELRWYRQWIEEEWNEIEQQWLKDTFCTDPADNKEHNIAEVPLKDMFCTGTVKDKPATNISDDGGNASTITMDSFVLTFTLLATVWTSLRPH